MRYIKFEINNYKGIENVVIDMKKSDSKIYTLVGLNESGKTTILEAISLLWNDINLDQHHKLIPKSVKHNFNGKVTIKATIEINDSDKSQIEKYLKQSHNFKTLSPIQNSFTIEKYYEFQDSLHKKHGRIWSIRLNGIKNRGKENKSFSSKTDEWIGLYKFIESNLLPRIIYYPNFLFDIPSKIQIKPIPEKKEDKIFYDMLQDILDSMNMGLNIEKHIVKRMEEDTGANKTALKATINKISGKVTELVLKTWGEVMNSHGKEIVFEQEIETDTEDDTKDIFYLKIDLKDGNENYPISERSLGFRWFFSFLLFTELRKHRSNDPGETIFLIDEPASNLHSTAQKRLLDTFDKIVEDNSKLIYTTHSHHLINPKYLESAYVVKNTALDYGNDMNFEAAKTKIEAHQYKSFVAKHPNQKDYYQPILDLLDYEPGLLELIPYILVTEGKNDFYSLHYINDNHIEPCYKLYIYPGNGAGQIDFLIQLYLAWGKNFKVLLDSDERGKREKDRYIEKYGYLIKDCVFTYLDIDEQWDNYSIENLYSESDKDKILSNIQPNYTNFSKKLFHLEIQNLAAAKNKIALDPVTISNFDKVICFFDFEK